MASSITNSIRSALDDLELLDQILLVSGAEELIFFLKNLETFVLCARKFVKDGRMRSNGNDFSMDRNLGSLLETIGDAVCRNAAEIEPYCADYESGTHPINIELSDVHENIRKFKLDMMCFQKDIHQWYKTMSDSLPLQQSSSKTMDEVTEIIDSLLLALESLILISSWVEFSLEPMEVMGEKIKLFRKFIRFVALLSVEHQQLEIFLIHVTTLAFNAAHLTAKLSFRFSRRSKKWWRKIQPKILVLLQKIKSVDPRVSGIYTAVLACPKLSTESHSRTLDPGRDPVIIMRDFIDFLQWNLWETLQTEASPVTYTKDQLQLLYKGLTFLRSILKKQPNKFDERVRSLSRAMICDAGVIIFSLHQKDVMDLGLPDLLEKLKMIGVEVGEQVPETPIFNFPKTNVMGFLHFLSDKLMEVKSCDSDSDTKNYINTMEKDLVSLREFLASLLELRDQKEDLQAHWNRALEVAYRIEFLIDQLVLGDIGDSFSASFDSIKEDIRVIKADADVFKIFHDRRQEIKAKEVTWIPTQVPSQGSAPATDEVVGFKDETTSVINRLTRGSKKLQMVAIVGMPGSGKTTLATKVYNHPSVVHHFHVRAWCSISQVFNQMKVLVELLTHILPKLPEKYFEMTEHDLVQELRRSLKQRRYLIFLDDVWDIEAWNILKLSFPDDSSGSRIILTSRHVDVAPKDLLDDEPLPLRQLTDDESWELLQKKLLPSNDCPLALYEVGKQIAKNCKGLPLTVVIVAGVLTTLELEVWQEVLESLSSSIVSSEEQCMKTLELSYKHLPDHLKPCFLYFGLFPEDQEFSIKRLIWLWISEGFIRKNELKSLEDVASNYMMDLIGRSIVVVAKKRSRGGVKACRIHDLLHDFCRTKAKEENFFQLLTGYDELVSFNEPGYLRRLCIHSEEKHFKDLRLFSSGFRSLLFFNHNAPGSIRYDISFFIRVFKQHLSVLDIQQIDSGCVFPSEIEFLVQLRYLAVKGRIKDIPPSIGNLSNLETFMVDSIYSVTLPDTFWNLHKLRHLSTTVGFRFHIENLDSSSDLYEMESCSVAIIFSSNICEKMVRKFPNVRKLKCRVFYHWDTEKCNEIIIPDMLGHLESLNISFFYGNLSYEPLSLEDVQLKFSLSANLKKLTLSSFWLSQTETSTIGELPNLEVLKLLKVDFEGETWDVAEGELSKLRFLELADSKIVRWTASDDQFPDLEKLVLSGCKSLEEIPSCLESISTLEMIEVSNCSPSAVNFSEQIQRVQMEMGNSALKIHISRDSSEFS